MTWQVIQFMDENPRASFKDVIGHFAEQLEVDSQHQFLLREVDKVLEIRDQLRPLYGEKMNLEQNMALIDSELDMDVMIEYPPRKGTDADRKKLKQKLRDEHADYPGLTAKFEQTKEDIKTFESQMEDVQQRAKNARRVLETFNHTISFVMAHYQSAISTPIPDFADNVNVF